MILRKPYAFLIKHFRLVHLILVLPIFYVLRETKGLVDFINSYISAGYITNLSNIAGIYIKIWVYIFTIFIVLGIAIIYSLMKEKRKSNLIYKIILIFYIVFFLILTVLYSVLSGIETGSLDAKIVRVIGDISFLIYYPQYIFCIFVIMRGVGFSLKKLNFTNDIAKDLKIDENDRAEFEININVDSNKYQKNFRRLLRELRYYYKENKFIIFTIIILIIGIVGTSIYMNFGVYNKKYKQQQVMSYNGLTLSVEKSFITNKDYSGKVITNNYFFVVVLDIQNLSNEMRSLDPDLIYLNDGINYKTPIIDRGSYFIDYGFPYTKSTEFKAKSEGKYVFVYEINQEDVNKTFTIKILESLNVKKKGELSPNYKIIYLDPQKYLDIEDKVYRMGKIIIMDDSSFGLTELKIKDYNILNKYDYSYQKCYSNGSCSTLSDSIVPQIGGSLISQTLLILDVSLTLDQTIPYYKNKRTDDLFFDNLATVQYTIGETVKEMVAKNLTPKEIKNKIILQVPEDIINSVSVKLFITTRNIRYITVIK